MQGSGEQLILDEGRVNKFNKRFASIGSFGQVAPASTGGDKKLEYKVGHEVALPCQFSDASTAAVLTARLRLMSRVGMSEGCHREYHVMNE